MNHLNLSLSVPTGEKNTIQNPRKQQQETMESARIIPVTLINYNDGIMCLLISKYIKLCNVLHSD